MLFRSREDGLDVGREEGIVTAREEGSDTLARLLQSLTAAGKSEEIDRVLHDSNYRKQLLSDYFQKENT